MKLKDSKGVFRAFSDETRLRIMNLLGEGELCVCDVVRVLREPQSKISRHLAYLRRAGLVTARKDGLWMHYSSAAKGARVFESAVKALCRGEGCMEEFQKDRAKLHLKERVLVRTCR